VLDHFAVAIFDTSLENWRSKRMAALFHHTPLHFIQRWINRKPSR